MKELHDELRRHYALLLGVRSPWEVTGVNLDTEGKRVEIGVEWGRGHELSCPECGKRCAMADHAPERTWRHLDTMQFETRIRARTPRSRCPEHGVKTVVVPWAEPGSRFTLLFERFAIDVLLACRSLTQACDLLGLDWDAVQRIMDRAVRRGLQRRELEGLAHAGIDEKSFGSGQSCISLLSDLDGSRVLEVVEGCDQQTAGALWQSLAESALCRRFCGIGEIERVRVPGKSRLQTYSTWLAPEAMRAVLDELLRSAGSEVGAARMGLEARIELNLVLLDSTCLKANIHFPTDWVLLRAALAQRWAQTDWSRGQAQQILRRIDGILEQLPAAIKQAHERIIGERPVAGTDKILSLHEQDLHVIVRGKAGAEVERVARQRPPKQRGADPAQQTELQFGNTLLLGENLEGIIVDHALLRERSPGDTRLLEESLVRIEALRIAPVLGVGSDRGFASRANSRLLEEKDIFDAMCPRNPADITRRHREDWLFADCQRRRAQTEARVGILKNNFLSGQPRARGYERRAAAVDWAVLAHNLRIIARLPQAKALNAPTKDPPPASLAA